MTVIYWVTAIYRPIIYTGPLTVQSTPDKSKVGVDRRLKQLLIGKKQMSKWMGTECKYHAHFTSSATTDID